MFVVLAAGVVAMGAALFRPTATPQLIKDALHAPARANAMSGSGGTIEIARESTKSTLPPTSSSSADVRSSAANREPKLVVTSITAGAAPTAATPVSSNKQTASSPAIATSQMASLHIRLEHRFPAAQVLVWVDDKLAYKESVDGTVKRRMRMFKTVEGYKSGSVQLASGEHRIRVRVQSADNSYDRTGTITAVVPQKGERQLKIDCTNRKQIQLAIE